MSATGQFVAKGISESDDIVVYYLDEGLQSCLYVLRISLGFSWTLSLRGVTLNSSTCPALNALPEFLPSAADVGRVLTTLTTLHVCEGNADERFIRLADSWKGRFLDTSGNI